MFLLILVGLQEL